MKTPALSLLFWFLVQPWLSAHPTEAFDEQGVTRAQEVTASGVAYLAGLSQLAVEVGLPEEQVVAQGEALLGMMPKSDRGVLTAEDLLLNHRLALLARSHFPWAGQVSEALFTEHVLPYASLDETRESWRLQFFQICSRLVADCQTASEAAQILNRDLFNELEVHYNTGRKKPNQSPSESRALKKATCTGLSIILNYACRSVGIPSRIVGTPLWSDGSGNHTWVEIWDQKWYYLGADEYDSAGLDRGWFSQRAAQAKEEDWQHAIWAVSWGSNERFFPLVWNLQNQEIGAVNVTERYRKNTAEVGVGVGIRVFGEEGGKRLPAVVTLRSPDGAVIAQVTSKAGQADLNDVARVDFEGPAPWTVEAEYEGRYMSRILKKKPSATIDLILAESEQPNVNKIRDEWFASERAARERDLTSGVIAAAGQEMKFLEKTFGKKPARGHSLWISLHGGGGAPAAVNDQQWANQIRLYEPEEGIYVAPRAPTDTWNLWHQAHIDDLLDRLIANYVICRGVDPNRVYLMGYSAGGDGVYQLAPRMADRFAAASMMAGHPNDARPDNLMNLPFEVIMGGQDTAFQRNETAAAWGRRLQKLQKGEPRRYPHKVTIYPELGHWMNRRDAAALPRMSKNSRLEWPRKVVWVQDDVTHERLYWLGVAPKGMKAGRKITAEIEGQTIRVQSENPKGIRLWLSPALLDLQKEVVVICNEEEVFRAKVPQSAEVVRRSLKSRSGMIATALLEIP